MAKRFEDLHAWQLADQLKEEVFKFIATTPASRDFKYRDQISESARSAPRNVAEGFARYFPSSSVPFYFIALASLNETFNHLLDGRKREFLSEDEFVRLRRLNFRAIKALKRLIEYLEGPGQSFNRKSRPRRPLK